MQTLNLKVIPKFEPLFRNEIKQRIVIYYGGRGSGKTSAIVNFLTLKLFEEKNINILVLRKNEKDNRTSTYEEFIKIIRDNNLDSIFISRIEKLLNFNLTTITNNVTKCKIWFAGFSEATFSNIKGKANVKYCWIEEADFIKKELWEVLIPSIRAESSQFFLTLNPKTSQDFIYKEYIKDKINNNYIYTCEVNYSDNIYFPAVMEKDRLFDYENKPQSEYEHVWLGKPADRIGSLINVDKIGFFDDFLSKEKYYFYQNLFISCDTAFSTKTNADYSVLSLFGVWKPNNSDKYELHYLRMIRGKWDFNSLIENVKNLYNFTNEIYHKSPILIIETKGSGISLKQELERNFNIEIVGVNPTLDKYTRFVEAMPYIYNDLKFPLSKNIINNFIEDVKEELIYFRADDSHKHDDIIDTITQAIKIYLQNISVSYSNFMADFLKV